MSHQGRLTGVTRSSMGNTTRLTAVNLYHPRLDGCCNDDDDDGRGRRNDKGGWRSRIFWSFSRVPTKDRECDRSESRHRHRKDISSTSRGCCRPLAAPSPTLTAPAPSQSQGNNPDTSVRYEPTRVVVSVQAMGERGHSCERSYQRCIGHAYRSLLDHHQYRTNRLLRCTATPGASPLKIMTMTTTAPRAH